MLTVPTETVRDVNMSLQKNKDQTSLCSWCRTLLTSASLCFNTCTLCCMCVHCPTVPPWRTSPATKKSASDGKAEMRSSAVRLNRREMIIHHVLHWSPSYAHVAADILVLCSKMFSVATNQTSQQEDGQSKRCLLDHVCSLVADVCLSDLLLMMGFIFQLFKTCS